MASSRREQRRRRTVAVGALAAGALAAVAALWSLRDGEGGTLRAAFEGAVQVAPGHEVRVAGRPVGDVESVEYGDGQAVLELRIEDSRVWPLPRGTTARLRFGTTSSYAARYVELEPGPSTAPPLPDAGLLTRAQTLTPVEFDDMNRLLDEEARGDLRGVIGNLAATLDGRERALGPGVRSTAAAVDELAALMHELGADRAALRTLVDSGATMASAIASREDELRALVTNAATTFDELAAHAAATRATFDRFPTTLRVTRASLARLDQSLVGLTALVGDVEPGASRLRELAPIARRVTATLHEMAPLTTSALRRARRASPSIHALLRDGTPFMERLRRALDEAAPQFACIRPYAPEVAGVLSTWSGFPMNYDSIEHYGRLLPMQLPFRNGTDQTSAEVVESTPSAEYAFPRPPGLNAGQPWFIRECDYGPETLDPGRDPEARTGDG